MPTYPEVHVKLTGRDGNAFAIIGSVSKALRKAGHADAAERLCEDAMQCRSYDQLLRLVMRTVTVS